MNIKFFRILTTVKWLPTYNFFVFMFDNCTYVTGMFSVIQMQLKEKNSDLNMIISDHQKLIKWVICFFLNINILSSTTSKEKNESAYQNGDKKK